mmetsp:Transcript_1905/g.2644  ORF Transcript_1905/g.2644 Transcript_1905/m.2644 type:complete len:585 (+) Transcript_1905:85-1839(+)
MAVTFSGINHGDDISSTAEIPSVMTGLTSMTPRIHNLSKKPKPVDLDDPVKTELTLMDLCGNCENTSRQKIVMMILLFVFVVSIVTVLISIIIAMRGGGTTGSLEIGESNSADIAPFGIQFPSPSPDTHAPSAFTAAPIEDVPSRPVEAPISPTLRKSFTPSTVPTHINSIAPSTKRAFSNANDVSRYTIVGSQNYEAFGFAAAMNGDGTIIAVGAPSAASAKVLQAGRVEVYKWKNDEWVPMGNPIYGRNSKDQFGWSVALSKNGDVLVASEPGFDVPHVGRAGNIRSFSWDSGLESWIPFGQEIRGERTPSQFGNDLSISGDGTVLVVGAPGETRMYWQDGRVRAYRFYENSWEPLGQPLDGNSAQDWFGSSVDISENGQKIAIGAPHNTKNGGYVRVYNLHAEKMSGSDSKLQWIQLGDDIVNEMYPVKSSDRFGISVSLDQDKIAIGAPSKAGSSGKLEKAGFAIVYSYENTASKWSLMGSPIEGNKVNAELGTSLCLNGDDLLVGVPNIGGVGEVVLYEYDSSDWLSTGLSFRGNLNEEFGHVVISNEDSTGILSGAPAATHSDGNSGSISIFIVPTLA